MQVDIICDDAALFELRDSWNLLAGDIPFLRIEWLATWWKHYQLPEWQLFVITVRDSQGQLIGVLPLYRSSSLISGKVLRFLGSGEVCSDYLTLLAADGAKSEVATVIGDWLADQRRGGWDLIELIGLDASDTAIGKLAQQLRAHGYHVHSRPGQNCWRLDFPATWDDYLRSLSKSRRERVRKLLRRNFDTGRVAVGLLEDPNEFDRYFDRLLDLHQRRRVSLGEPGCFASSRFISFHHDVMQQMLSLGLLRLWWTELDGVPAAMEYALTGGETIYFYQGGFEPRLAKEYPGWLSTIGSLRSAFDQGFRHFDFLRGDEPYKASWGATSRPAMELRIIARRLVPTLRYAAWRTKKLVGHLKRRCTTLLSGAVKQSPSAVALNELIPNIKSEDSGENGRSIHHHREVS